jgi:hypothetical protein
LAPADAPKASSLDHSLCVICDGGVRLGGMRAVEGLATYVQLISTCRNVSMRSAATDMDLATTDLYPSLRCGREVHREGLRMVMVFRSLVGYIEI